MTTRLTTARGSAITTGSIIVTGQQRWAVTRVCEAAYGGMLVFWTDPQRHKPIHSYPNSVWTVEVQA